MHVLVFGADTSKIAHSQFMQTNFQIIYLIYIVRSEYEGEMLKLLTQRYLSSSAIKFQQQDTRSV